MRRGITPNMVTDQTSAHDALNGYIPAGMSLGEAEELRAQDPQAYIERSMESMVTHVRAMLEMQARGAIVFDYGNNLRGQALEAGETHALDFPGFVAAYIRPLFCRGKGPFRWVALSGDPEDIYRTDEAILKLFPQDAALARWITLARQKIHFQGLPARICWLGYGQRDKAGLAFNDLVARGVIPSLQEPKAVYFPVTGALLDEIDDVSIGKASGVRELEDVFCPGLSDAEGAVVARGDFVLGKDGGELRLGQQVLESIGELIIDRLVISSMHGIAKYGEGPDGRGEVDAVLNLPGIGTALAQGDDIVIQHARGMHEGKHCQAAGAGSRGRAMGA